MIKAGGSVRRGVQARRWLASVTLALCLDAVALGLAGALLGLSAAPMAARVPARPALRVRLNPAVAPVPAVASGPSAPAVPLVQPASAGPTAPEQNAAPREPAPPGQPASTVQAESAAESATEDGLDSVGAAPGPGGQDTISGAATGQAALLRQLEALIRSNLAYPPLARARNIQGEVRVSVLIGTDGGLAGSSVVSGSGSPILDKAAISLVRDIFPLQLDHALDGPVSIVVRIVYSLTS